MSPWRMEGPYCFSQSLIQIGPLYGQGQSTDQNKWVISTAARPLCIAFQFQVWPLVQSAVISVSSPLADLSGVKKVCENPRGALSR